ncbi:MAG: glycosyltransferase family 39 protein [Planctomycetes bacterium]|nr:glycosyltransferase family 39 protein [Planctomycetota bacterium]
MKIAFSKDNLQNKTIIHLLLLITLGGTLFFYKVSTLPLTDPDEARCGLIIRDMIRNHHWLIPHLESEPYFDKPAPFFWLAAAVQKITGDEESPGRIIAGLFALAAVLITYAAARNVFNPLAGLLAGVMLITTGEFLYIARWYRMDMPFAASMWAGLWLFLRAEIKRQNEHRYKGGWIGFYLFCAVATLFKGPAGLVLPVLTVATYLLLSGKPRRFFELFNLKGIILYLLISAPWYVAISLKEPHYAYEFFIRQNIARYTTSTFGHSRWPAVIYIPILLAGLMPWTIYLPGICIRYFPRRWSKRNNSPAILFLWLAALVPLIFFSLSKTKLMNYILPLFPPLAVMIGGLIAGWILSNKPDSLMMHGARAAFIMVLLLPLAPASIEIWLGNLDYWIFIPVAASAICAGLMWKSLSQHDRGQFVGWEVAAVIIMFLFTIGHTAPAGFDKMSWRSLIKEAESAIQPCHSEARFYYRGCKIESIMFYLDADKIEKIAKVNDSIIPAMRNIIKSPQPCFCFIGKQKYFDEIKLTFPGKFIILAQHGQRYIIASRLR